MKLNNKGFGTKEMIIYSCIIIFLLLLADILIHSMYKSLENTDESNSNNEVETIKVDTAYYHKKENELKNATLEYLRNYEVDITDSLNLDISILKSHDLIDDIYDSDGDSVCSAYSIVVKTVSDYDVVPILNCSDYSTEE